MNLNEECLLDYLKRPVFTDLREQVAGEVIAEECEDGSSLILALV